MPNYETPFTIPENLNGLAVHLVGAKGTGVSALAELLCAQGARVTGSDVAEEFYTDAVLAELGVPVVRFSADALAADTAFVVHSAAYDQSNPVIAEALRRKIPVGSYPQVLGAFSRRQDSTAIAGVHGKTTTTAMIGSLCRATGLPATVVVGSAVAGFGNRSTWNGGGEFFIAETCEYRRHFLNYHPQRIVLTSVESDHQDYYPDYRSIRDAFVEFVLSLPPDGQLIYCCDDKGASEVAAIAAGQRTDILMIPYGEAASGPWRVVYGEREAGVNRFRVAAYDMDFHLSVPGRHLAMDAVAALIVVSLLQGKNGLVDEGLLSQFQHALADFKGSRRRSEIIGEKSGILVMDDYAHHPTAIVATLAGLKDFHPDRRMVVDFMPHTYSRTAALLEDFARAFSDADVLILHGIYASAREHFEGNLTGKVLYDRAVELRGEKPTLYFERPSDATKELPSILRPGDLFVTLGAGNNWTLGHELIGDER